MIEDQLLADIVDLAKRIFKEKPNAQTSTSAYLLNMAIRLKSMRRVLKNTGSIYLHCDPTASHYLKLIMDAIFGFQNFLNEIVWCYKSGGASPSKFFSRKHDVIFLYVKNKKEYQFNSQLEKSYNRDFKPYRFKGVSEYKDDIGWYTMVGMKDYWQIDMVGRTSSERLGYPTQKPLELLKRIIKVSSNEGDLVLDPFCGCGTTLHAAEELKRKWIGIDISQFAAGLVRNRLLNEFKQLNRGEISVIGCPLTVVDAQNLAKSNPFEFEKWICGEVGAQGLFHEPGEKGADGGVDGVIPFYHSEALVSREIPQKTFAIVQVKGGKVTPDSVRALSTTVRQAEAKCGIMICFDKYMPTVENNREKGQIKDMMGNFSFIQGLSVERLIEGELPNIPGIRKAD